MRRELNWVKKLGDRYRREVGVCFDGGKLDRRTGIPATHRGSEGVIGKKL